MISDVVRLIMPAPIAQTLIEGRIDNGHLVIPHGMTPIYLQSVNGKMIAYVDGWTAQKEYDQNSYDLYPLDKATHFVQPFKVNDESADQDWHRDFGAPTKTARRDVSGVLDVLDRV
jgi:hypothetical protein